MDYTADDGLRILDYLGFRITEQEKGVFHERWSRVYDGRKRDLILTIWELYSETLPFILNDGDRNSFILAQLRDRDFGERLELSDLDDLLKRGVPIREI